MSYLTVFNSISGTTFEEASASPVNSEAEEKPVRRPLRGFLLQQETYASLSVVGGPSVGPLANSSVEGTSTFTTNFLLQSVTETRNEKVQYVTTFGSTYAFFFGEQPRIINCAAVLLNSPDFNWEKEWWYNYENVLRGSSLTSSNMRASLQYDGCTITGYLTNCTAIKSAQDPLLVQVNFSMFVEGIVFDSEIGSTAVYSQGNPNRADLLGVGNVVNSESFFAESEFESTTASVRRANIKIGALAPVGKLGKLAGALSAIDGALNSFVRTARNLLYGRNLVVPQSFTGERYSQPIFPEGTGATGTGGLAGESLKNFFGKSQLTFADEDTVVLPGSSTVTLRSNTDGFLTTEYLINNQKTNGKTTDNFDEYVNVPPRSSTLTELYDGAIAQTGAGAFLGTELTLEFIDEIAAADRLILNDRAVNAFAAFGVVINSPTPYSSLVDPVTQYRAQQTKEKIWNAARVVCRAGFGLATFYAGQSMVNKSRELQESITNPNTGGLSSAQIAELNAEMSQTQLAAEQERLIADVQADALRGNTGTVSPSLLETALSVVL